MPSPRVVDHSMQAVSSIEPIYERLPRGPHGLGPEVVARHQRMRLHGAMVEAVAAKGYERTTVRQVIGLAGVSRRAFYEQFADKRSCFLSTFDLIAARWVHCVQGACASSKGELRGLMRGGVRAFVQEIARSPKSAHLVLIDAETIGPEGTARQRRLIVTLQRALVSAFEQAAGPGSLHPQVALGLIGGMRRSACIHLFEERRSGRGDTDAQALAREMLRWAMLFDPSCSDRERVAAMSKTRGTEDGEPAEPVIEELATRRALHRRPTGQRCRLLLSVLALAAEGDFEEIGPVRIADRAGSSLDAFLDMFKSRDDCFLAAFDTLSDELLAIAADPSLIDDDWAIAVPMVISAIMRHLAANPLYLHTIGTSVCAAGEQAMERNFELARDVATLLTEGAPDARSDALTEWIAGGVWQILEGQGRVDRAHLMPDLTPYISEVVLTPFLGVDAARAAIGRSIEGQALRKAARLPHPASPPRV